MNDTFIVGDIHGCFDELKDLLALAGWSQSRHDLLLLGDVINKGPLSFEALKWVRENGISTVVGNHEMRFLEGLRQGKSLSPQMKELADQMGADLEDWLQWIDDLPTYLERDFSVAKPMGI
ncbi:MAG: metallophosphoesterase, partial [Pseudomonadota bacterium]